MAALFRASSSTSTVVMRSKTREPLNDRWNRCGWLSISSRREHPSRGRFEGSEARSNLNVLSRASSGGEGSARQILSFWSLPILYLPTRVLDDSRATLGRAGAAPGGGRGEGGAMIRLSARSSLCRDCAWRVRALMGLLCGHDGQRKRSREMRALWVPSAFRGYPYRTVCAWSYSPSPEQDSSFSFIALFLSKGAVCPSPPPPPSPVCVYF